jgi:hypothetical protein
MSGNTMKVNIKKINDMKIRTPGKSALENGVVENQPLYHH